MYIKEEQIWYMLLNVYVMRYLCVPIIETDILEDERSTLEKVFGIPKTKRYHKLFLKVYIHKYYDNC